jgi:Family of unknown function (DUF6510)
MEALDGNAIAGALFEHFGEEMTTASGTCAHCHNTSLLGELRVYLRAPGAVSRCPVCGNVVMVIVEVRGAGRFDLRYIQLLGHGDAGG